MSEERGEFEPNEAARASWTRPKEGVPLAEFAAFAEEAKAYSTPIEVHAGRFEAAMQAHEAAIRSGLLRHGRLRGRAPISFHQGHPDGMPLGGGAYAYGIVTTAYLVPSAELGAASTLAEDDLEARYPSLTVTTALRYEVLPPDGRLVGETLDQTSVYAGPKAAKP